LIARKEIALYIRVLARWKARRDITFLEVAWRRLSIDLPKT
jgi:hypothetical protein